MPRPLWHHRCEISPFPLWRAGQQPWPDGTAAGKQGLSHPDRDAGGDAVQEGTGARGAASGLE